MLIDNIDRIVHFHCDHFEPFRKDKNGNTIGLKATQNFIQECQKHEHSRKLSLFISSQKYYFVHDKTQIDKLPRVYPAGDLFFADSSHANEEDDLLDFLNTFPGIDFHYHLHHEWWTASECTVWPTDPELDGERIRGVAQFQLEHFAKHTRLNPKSWAFVHGCWAVNASDLNICRITNELKILQDLGCVADFTFPAGRSWCDPILYKEPRVIQPFDAEKCYDRIESEPVSPIGYIKNTGILIWSANTPSGYISIETIAKMPQAQLKEVVNTWLVTSPVINRTLYIKTHCHSMWWENWLNNENTPRALLSDNVKTCFEMLKGTGVTVIHMTAREVMDDLQYKR
jgi:hypothetical protein